MKEVSKRLRMSFFGASSADLIEDEVVEETPGVVENTEEATTEENK